MAEIFELCVLVNNFKENFKELYPNVKFKVRVMRKTTRKVHLFLYPNTSNYLSEEEFVNNCKSNTNYQYAASEIVYEVRHGKYGGYEMYKKAGEEGCWRSYYQYALKNPDSRWKNFLWNSDFQYALEYIDGWCRYMDTQDSEVLLTFESK